MNMSKGVAREAREQVRRLVHYAEGLSFDVLYGVSTRGIVSAQKLSSTAPDPGNYEGTSPLGFRNLLRRLRIDPTSYTFVDLGCGKGRTLILAALSGFNRTVGVEIAPDLLKVADRNLAALRARRPNLQTQFELVEADAATYIFPSNQPILVYMYNPFGEYTMRAVARNISSSIEQSGRPFRVVYYIPHFSVELDRVSSLRCTYRDPRRAIYASTGFQGPSSASKDRTTSNRPG